MRRSQLHRQQVLLRARTAYHNRDMIRRASRRPEALHLLHEEWNQRPGVLNTRLRLLIQIGLVRAAAAFRYAQEAVLHAFRRLYVYLRGQVAFRVHFLVHRQRRVLRIAQVIRGVGVEDAFAQCLFIAVARPYLLTFLAVYDSRSRVLTQRQLPFASHLRVAQEGQRHILIVSTCLRVAQYLRHLLVMRTAKHKTHIVERLLRHQRQTLCFHFQHRMSLELADRHIVFRQQIILRLIFTHLKHRCILKFHIYRCLLVSICASPAVSLSPPPVCLSPISPKLAQSQQTISHQLRRIYVGYT